MAYTHGVYVRENPTSIIAPIEVDCAIQVVIGTAPINMAKDIKKAVNTPMIVNSFSEAVSAVGYSNDFSRFTLCQSIDASFRVYNIAPLVLINVLDPEKHSKEEKQKRYNFINKRAIIEREGVLLDTIIIKSGTSTLKPFDDYVVAFDDNGYVIISAIDESITDITVDYKYLSPEMVTELDIIGGYNVAEGVSRGLELIDQIYPRLGIIPGQILAPGWSHLPSVCAVMCAKAININGSFKCTVIADIDSSEAKTYDSVLEWKNRNGYTNENLIVCYPMVTIGGKKYYFSAVWTALTAYVDGVHDNVPYKSPSNEILRITGTVNQDDTEIYLDQLQGNYLNGFGVCTAININGWRSWGNNTSIYPANTDVKDRYIPVRRMFNWWGNTFIRTYSQKVDNPMNFRLIESIIDSENIRANGLRAKGMIASGKISFNTSENPMTDILNGKLRFKQQLAFFTPAETIIDVLEFDPEGLGKTLIGGNNKW